jgi:hypothetical protein
VTGGGRPVEHRGRPQGVEVRVHGIGDHSTMLRLTGEFQIPRPGGDAVPMRRWPTAG